MAEVKITIGSFILAQVALIDSFFVVPYPVRWTGGLVLDGLHLPTEENEHAVHDVHNQRRRMAQFPNRR